MSTKDRLGKLVENLVFPSEADAPFTVVEYGKPRHKMDAAEILRLHYVSPKMKIDESQANDFFANLIEPYEWHGVAEKKAVERYKALAEFFTTELTEVRVYRFGKVNVTYIIVGMSAEGGWLGLQTEAVET